MGGTNLTCNENTESHFMRFFFFCFIQKQDYIFYFSFSATVKETQSVWLDVLLKTYITEMLSSGLTF